MGQSTNAIISSAPPVQRYAVTLKFTDGVYERCVAATSEKRAVELAHCDARMASPFNSYSGELLEWQAVLVLP